MTRKMSSETLSPNAMVDQEKFEQRLLQLLANFMECDSQHTLCYIDLDPCRFVNDIGGDEARDSLWRLLAERIAVSVRPYDTLAWLGDAQIGILMEHCPISDALRIATGLRKQIMISRFERQGKRVTIDTSIGLSPITQAQENVASALGLAIAACYAAKDQGRNKIQVCTNYDKLLPQQQAEMRWASRISRALDDERFTLYYQSIVPLSNTDHRKPGCELLLRLRENDTLISPCDFMPAAEHYCIADRLDRWVVDTAFDLFDKHPRLLNGFDMWSINLSAASLRNEHFVQFVAKKIDDTNIAADKICFEVDESSALANLDKAKQFIEILEKRACRLGLDDFGRGLSSLAYLRTLNVSYLKIDGVFIRNIVSDPIMLSMVKSLSDFAHRLGKQTIAKFAYTDTIVDKLRGIGVDYAQGFALSLPVPLSQLSR